MSQEHDKTKPENVAVSSGIHTEPAPFEPAYQPETLPQITVPDLAEDAQGLSAEALANVPTLTDLVDEAPAADAEVAEQASDAVETAEAADTTSPEPVTEIQEPLAQADTWVEVLHVRMGKLNGDIQTLNARLDRLEERNKTKV